MPKVYNKKFPHPPDAIYIGRPSKWGNPFIIGRDGTRAQVIERYRLYLSQNKFLIESLKELKGKDMVCFCHPLLCHGDVLLKLANSEPSSIS